MPGFFCCCDLRPKPQGFFDRLIIDADPVQEAAFIGRHAALALRGLAHGEQQLLADGIDQRGVFRVESTRDPTVSLGGHHLWNPSKQVSARFDWPSSGRAQPRCGFRCCCRPPTGQRPSPDAIDGGRHRDSPVRSSGGSPASAGSEQPGLTQGRTHPVLDCPAAVAPVAGLFRRASIFNPLGVGTTTPPPAGVIARGPMVPSPG